MNGAYTREIEVASRLARQAGRILLEVFGGDFEVVEKPGGAGPVTVADLRANALIVDGLRAAFPNDGIVAEESAGTEDAVRFERCWFVDPLDGTKEFVQGVDQFAVHIGLAVGGAAMVGVVYQPAADKLYAGAVGAGCRLEDGAGTRSLRVADRVEEPLRMVVSRSHRSKRLVQICDELGVQTLLRAGSVGIKCGMLAEGRVDLYVHASRKSSRWDACAPEAIVRAAGGFFGDLAGNAFRYDGRDVRNLHGLLACHPAALPRVLPVVRTAGYDAGLLP